MKLKLIPIYQNIKEEEFPNYIKKRGWSCLRNNKINKEEINKIILKSNSNYLTNNFQGIGKPDFFISKNQKFYFCEFKSRKDSVRNEQLSWMFHHLDYPKAIAFSCEKREINKLEIEEDWNEVINNWINKKTKNITQEYYEEERESIFPNYQDDFIYIRKEVKKLFFSCLEEIDWRIDKKTGSLKEKECRKEIIPLIYQKEDAF